MLVTMILEYQLMSELSVMSFRSGWGDGLGWGTEAAANTGSGPLQVG